MQFKNSSKNSNLAFFRILQVILVLLPIIFLSTIGGVTSINASSNDEVSCYDRGFIDGEDHPFSQSTYDRCGNDYYEGFINGCMSVEVNSRDTCEIATDG